MSFDKYIGKYRIIYIQTDNKNNADYLKFIEKYNKYKKYFDNLNTIIKKKLDSSKFKIILIGLDGSQKKKYYSYVHPKDIIKVIESMPIAKQQKKLSLYADYHPEKSQKSLGFKSKSVAKFTIAKIKSKPIAYQFQVINTMYNRAKYHPYRTPDMEEAMKVFKKWLLSYKSKE